MASRQAFRFAWASALSSASRVASPGVGRAQERSMAAHAARPVDLAPMGWLPISLPPVCLALIYVPAHGPGQNVRGGGAAG